MKREFSAGGIIYKKTEKDDVFWLVTKSAPSEFYPKAYWRLPKGWIDDEGGGEKPGPVARGERKVSEGELRSAALREVREEAGVEAKIVAKIGTEKYFLNKDGERILKFVTFYLMKWLNDMPEGPGFETPEVALLPFEKARKKMKHTLEKTVFDKAKQILDSGIQEFLI